MQELIIGVSRDQQTEQN